jgi:hypothetical protein
VVLAVVDWPLRLVALPVLVATLAGHVSPDGRPAHRYLISRVALLLRPERRSLGRPLPTDGHVELWGPWRGSSQMSTHRGCGVGGRAARHGCSSPSQSLLCAAADST